MTGERIIDTGRVQIGLSAQRRMPRMDFPCSAPHADMVELQAALTGRNTTFSNRIDWDGIYIALSVVVATAAGLMWFWSR